MISRSALPTSTFLGLCVTVGIRAETGIRGQRERGGNEQMAALTLVWGAPLQTEGEELQAACQEGGGQW